MNTTFNPVGQLSRITLTQATRPQVKLSYFASSTSTVQGDSFEQKNNAKANIEKGLKDGSLTYTPEEKFFFGLYTREAQYTYTANGKETIADIKKKFGLSDGAISKCNDNIQDNNYVPQAGVKIFFDEKDVGTR